MQILDRAKAHFDCLPNVVEVSIGEGQQLTVVGDVHGQMPVRCCWSGLPVSPHADEPYPCARTCYESSSSAACLLMTTR